MLPKTFLLLSMTYFAAYQVYYFSEIINENNKYPFLQDIRFVPIWNGFMLGGGVLFCGGVYKLFKSLS